MCSSSSSLKENEVLLVSATSLYYQLPHVGLGTYQASVGLSKAEHLLLF